VVNCQFEFKRKLSVSIIQIFIPTISIVSVSWMSFFFHKNSVSPRVSFATTTLFSLSFLWGKVNQRLPKVSYTKAVDMYFMVSFSFILLSLLEYATVMNTDFRAKKEKKKDRNILVNSRRLLPLATRVPEHTRQTSEESELQPLSNSITKRRHTEAQNKDQAIELNAINNRCQSISLVYSTQEMLTKENVIKPCKSRHDTNNHLIASRLDIFSRYMFPISFFAFNVYFFVIFSEEH